MAAPPTPDGLESMLTVALGEPVRVESFEPLPPWAVARCGLRRGGGAVQPAIVKWLRDHPQGVRTDPRQMATERAALEFLAEIGFAAAPRLIAADPDVLVMTDLAPRVPLAERLRAEGLAALTGEMRAYARTLGELGAATAGKAERYRAIRSACGPEDPAVAGERGLGPDWLAAYARLTSLGLGMEAAAERDLATLLGTLGAPGPFLALSNGDTQVNNFLVGEGGGALIDFEAASFRHALTAAVLIQVPGPAWITVADPINAELEAIYRTALSAGVPEAEDDRRFGDGMAAACLAYALDRLTRFALVGQRPPGDASRVQMVATLEAAATAARRHRALPALCGWVDRAAAWLRQRWPDADVDLGGYAPYTPRT